MQTEKQRRYKTDNPQCYKTDNLCYKPGRYKTDLLQQTGGARPLVAQLAT